MQLVAIIGGSGLTNLKNLVITGAKCCARRSETVGATYFGHLGGQNAVFLARHGHGHTIPPHDVTIAPTSGHSRKSAPVM